MSAPEDFLARWSRRKREASEELAEPSPGEQAVPNDGAEATPVTSAPGAAADSLFDLSKLPPIDSITAETDITAFLAPGVPADLKLAALRRAWSADPKVRDFVGLADYDFDFHTPGAIPGFGPLEMTDDLRREVVRIVSAWQSEPEAPPATEPDQSREPTSTPAQPAAAVTQINAPPVIAGAASAIGPAAGPDHRRSAQDEVIVEQAAPQGSEDNIAMQQDQVEAEKPLTLAVRGHGRALPK